MSETAAQTQPPKLETNDDWVSAIPARGAFNADDCAKILALGGEMKSGTIGPKELGADHRDSKIDWIAATEENRWLYEKLKPVIVEANRRFFKMKLTGYTESLQLTEYREGQYYDWHMDFGPRAPSIRKLSFVLQLSEPSDYDGGDLEIMNSRDPQPMPREQGVIIIFPSFTLHRVSPVTRGIRRSLVGWIGGPPIA